MKTALVSFFIGFVVSVILMPLVIKLIYKLKGGQPILNYVEAHMSKSGTPTMGGVIFLIGGIVCFFALYNSHNFLALICLACMMGYGLIGFLDDFIKVRFKNNQGLKPYQKIIGQFGLAVLMGIFIFLNEYCGGEVKVPFGQLSINVGWFVIPLVIFVFLATTNAVNLTDGLDGLAGGVSVVFLAVLTVLMAINIENINLSSANVEYIGELQSVLNLTGGMVGVILAFLCFNSHPAKVFMGDTGSLALGGYIASVCSVTKEYLLIPILGIMFVLSAVSVVIQVLYYKATKKRAFLMAPLHHHFEKKGCYETKIVTIYIIITLLVGLMLIGFAI